MAFCLKAPIGSRPMSLHLLSESPGVLSCALKKGARQHQLTLRELGLQNLATNHAGDSARRVVFLVRRGVDRRAEEVEVCQKRPQTHLALALPVELQAVQRAERRHGGVSQSRRERSGCI